jgi:cell division septum initiation protein DivIVA|tara:strand:+ start:54 stop:305 length:252 start_codon:yes stop_codon:yes gene_type:complete
MENKETVNQENKAVVGDKEILESEMTEQQKYLANQITDLRNKEAKLTFDMDQIKAALTVFQNSFIASTKQEADKVLEENKKEK